MKYLKIIIANIILLILFFFIADYLVYLKFKNEYIITSDIENFPPISYIDNYKADYGLETLNITKIGNELSEKFRPASLGTDLNKKSILVFGCSYTYGTMLEPEQTISAKLSSSTKRSVYNFGIQAAGIQHMYFLIKNFKIFSQITTKPDYVIYVYIPDHIERLRANIFPGPMSTNGRYLKYKLCKDNSLKLVSNTFFNLSKTFLIRSLYYQFDLKRDNNSPSNKDYNMKLATQLFIESKKELEKIYPDIKFIILRYETQEGELEYFDKVFFELEKEGFTVIKSSDLIGRKYKYNSIDTVSDSYHPSEYAWDLLVPKLVEKLNL